MRRVYIEIRLSLILGFQLRDKDVSVHFQVLSQHFQISQYPKTSGGPKTSEVSKGIRGGANILINLIN